MFFLLHWHLEPVALLLVTVVVAWETSVLCCALLRWEWKRHALLNSLSSGSVYCVWGTLWIWEDLYSKAKYKIREFKVRSRYLQNVLIKVVNWNLTINMSNFCWFSPLHFASAAVARCVGNVLRAWQENILLFIFVLNSAVFWSTAVHGLGLLWQALIDIKFFDCKKKQN